jgi:hypothetical protein
MTFMKKSRVGFNGQTFETKKTIAIHLTMDQEYDPGFGVHLIELNSHWLAQLVWLHLVSLHFIDDLLSFSEVEFLSVFINLAEVLVHDGHLILEM